MQGRTKRTIALLIAAAGVSPALADGDAGHMKPMAGMMSSGLMMPQMSAERGRVLFASKGCVVCHSVNGVGGEDAPALDADTMDEVMNPFDFAARMWRGAAAMVALQEEELGGQIELTGQELADIIAFVHDSGAQHEFSTGDIPDAVKGMMHHMDEEDHHKEGEKDDHG